MTERLFQADAAPASVIIAGGRLVDPAAGFHGDAVDLRIENGRIAEIGPDLQHPDAETIDAAGLTVMPGLVDSSPSWRCRTPRRSSTRRSCSPA
jgi:dihydroorotase-like cyclic amidohydrolase